jgi:hypothetical protein
MSLLRNRTRDAVGSGFASAAERRSALVAESQGGKTQWQMDEREQRGGAYLCTELCQSKEANSHEDRQDGSATPAIQLKNLSTDGAMLLPFTQGTFLHSTGSKLT